MHRWKRSELYLRCFARAFREARMRKGISQQELENRVGITRKSISRFENGRNVTLETLFMLTEAMQVPIQDVVDSAMQYATVALADPSDEFLMPLFDAFRSEKVVQLPDMPLEDNRLWWACARFAGKPKKR